MIRTLHVLAMVALMSGSLKAQNHSTPETPYVQGEMLVQLRPGYSMDDLIKTFPADLRVVNKGLLSDEMNIYLLSFNDQFMLHADFMFQLYQLDGVWQAQNNHYIDTVRATNPNDPTYGTQWHHKQGNDADIDSDLAWDITTGGVTAQGDTIVVCVVEGGGAEWIHEDLVQNFWHNYGEIPNNSIDDDNNGYVDDFDGWRVSTANDNHGTGSHGTQCMGMIGARGNNSTDVVGANWNVKIMLVSGFSITESSVVAAYNYPLKMRKRYNNTDGATGAFVVATSSSWGIDNANPASYPIWCAFYDSLGLHGILSPAATTNGNSNIDVVGDMPTACSSPYMISVTRTGSSDNQAGGYGPINVDLGAPGISVVTTTNSNGTTSNTGTSFACPLTAGVIGLMYSVPCNSLMNIVKNNPKAGADSVLAALYAGVDIKPSLASITATGGRLNANNSVNYLVNNCSCVNPTSASVSGITQTTANVNFATFIGAGGSWIYYRLQGAPTFDSVYTTNGTAALTGLDSCEVYEYMIKSDCGGGDMSNGTSISTFTTVGDCGIGIAEPVYTYSFNVFPNPAADVINIEFTNYNKYYAAAPVVELYNPLGEKLASVTLTGKTTSMSTRSLANGMYVYRVKYGRGQMKTGRLVIAR